MNKANNYFKDTLSSLLTISELVKSPRTKWADGTPAYYFELTSPRFFEYSILNGELPIQTYRPTALKGAFYDIEAIYMKQTPYVSEMDKSIQNWWKPFIIPTSTDSIGQTYGDTVKRYDLMNNLLTELENNPTSRRHIMSLWQNEQMEDDKLALVPCAFMTMWHIAEYKKRNIVDLTLVQRSQDYMMTASINPMQYVMLGMMVCGHLSFKTGKKHFLGNFSHFIHNVHIYDRHISAAKDLLKNTIPSEEEVVMKLVGDRYFYDYKWEDFKITGIDNIPKFNHKLEIAR